VRVDVQDAVAGAVQLRPAQVCRTVDDLALQVAGVHHVVIHQANTTHPRGGQVHGQRRAQPACADEQDARRLQLLLPGHADLGHDQVPAVAAHLLV
jgi:hypothetical protein